MTVFCLTTALTIAASQVAVSAATPAQLEIFSGYHDYGVVRVGGSSAPIAFTVVNYGETASGPLQARIVGDDPADFQINGTTCHNPLAGAQSCVVDVSFRPGQLGRRSAQLQVGDGPSDTVTADVTGIGGTAQLAVGTAPAFGGVAIGASTAQTFTFVNSGVAPSGAIKLAFGGANPGDFAVTRSNCGGGLPIGGSCEATVTFTPKGGGIRSGTLDATANPGGSASAPLSGSGLTPAQLMLVPSSLDFGYVPVGTTSRAQQFVVENTGQADSGPLTVTLGGAQPGVFHITGCTGKLAGGQRCGIVVTFQPTAYGADQATVSIAATPGGTVTGTMSGAGPTPTHLSLSPMPFDFGTVGTDDAPQQTFTLTNSGDINSGPVTAALSGTLAPLFHIDSTTCTAGVRGDSSCTITVHFASSAPGHATAVLTVTASPGGTFTVPLSATAVDRAHLTITPATYDFGTVTSDQFSSVEEFDVVNTGRLTSGPVSVALSGPNAAAFTVISTTCGPALPTGGKCRTYVRFKADEAADTDTATLSATAGPGGTATSALQGESVFPPVLTLSPAVYDFANVPIGTSAFQTFTVTDTGLQATDSVYLFLEQSTGDHSYQISATTCGGPLPIGGSCTVTLRFDATDTNYHQGDIAACPSEFEVPCAETMLKGWGTPSAHFALSSPPDFGSVVTGTDSAEATVTVRNDGVATSGPVTVALSGANAADFTVDANGCATVAMKQSCQISVHLTPGATGDRTATLTVSGNPGGTATVTLHGTGIAVGVAPAAYAFPNQAAGTMSASHDFVLINHGSVPLVGLAVTGSDAADFPITGGTCQGGTVPAGGSCIVSVAFAAGSPGTYSSTLTASYLAGGAPQTLTFAATGTAG
ncbi:choice-of-anchor D domain-containing protein [Catenulispora acidiphila]|nr:choice-of-anchor D domain-containing protein [Catenulispora acidiphila]